MTETGTYVYAVGRGLDGELLADLTGVGGTPVRTLEHRGLVAVVNTVGLEEFGESALRRNLENLRWLEDTARRHDEIVRRAATLTAALVPFRLVTIYHSDDAVRDRIAELHADLVRALDRVDGRSEWSVKAYSRAQPEPSEQPASVASEGAGAGLAYLERRRAELHRREQATADQEELSGRLFRQLAAGAEAARRLETQDQRLTGRSEPMVFNGTFLVDDDRCTDFFRLVERLRGEYEPFAVELDGPWPPYSFATLDSP